MARQTRGTLTITSVRDEKARMEAARMLAEAEGRKAEAVAARLATLPYELGHNINEEDASDIILFLRTIGVTARFSPQMDKKLEKQAKKPAPSLRQADASDRLDVSGIDFTPGKSSPKAPPRKKTSPQKRATPPSSSGSANIDFRVGKKAPKVQKSKGSRSSSALEILLVPVLLFLLATALWAYIAFINPTMLVAG